MMSFEDEVIPTKDLIPSLKTPELECLLSLAEKPNVVVDSAIATILWKKGFIHPLKGGGWKVKANTIGNPELWLLKDLIWERYEAQEKLIAKKRRLGL